MKCQKCSAEISDVDTFCPECGTFLKEQRFERKPETKAPVHFDPQPKRSASKRAIVACPRCQQKLGVPEHEAPMIVTCPKCGGAFRFNPQASG